MNPVVVANVLVGLGWACVAASVVVPFVTKRVHHDVFWLGLVGLFVCGAAALFVLGVNIDQLPPAQGITGLLDAVAYVLFLPMQVLGGRADGTSIAVGVLAGVFGGVFVGWAYDRVEPPGNA